MQLCAGFILHFVAVLATFECKVCSHLPHIAIALELFSPVCNREKEEFADWRQPSFVVHLTCSHCGKVKIELVENPVFIKCHQKLPYYLGDPLPDLEKRQF